MGSQNTKALAESDLNSIEHAEPQKFSNDVCILIFSFINSAENTKFLVDSCSKVCSQWRQFIKYECGLKIDIHFAKNKELKKKLRDGCLKYYNVSSLKIRLTSLVNLNGKSMNSLCKGANSHLLRELNLTGTGCDAESFKIIVTTLRLESLNFSFNSISDDSLVILSQNEGMKNLRVLHVSGDFTNDGILAMTNSPYLKKLEEFYAHSPLKKLSIIALVDTFKLKALEFRVTKENDEVFEYFSKNENLSQLTYLSVQPQTYEYFESSICLIANNPFLTKLRYLDISRLLIENEGLVKLFSSHIMSTMKTLIADSCEIKKEEAIALASNRLIRNLTYLSLADNGIGSGFEALITSPIMRNVTSLNVSNSDPGIGNVGCLKIGSSEYLYNLTYLNISNNKINEVGIIGLTFGNMLDLKELNLSRNVFSDEAHQLLDDCIFLKPVEVDKWGCKYETRKPHPMK
ncbi:leucine rich repeat, typical subtype-like protein [Naegleria gruberi]|uniref:Leucine rich repeat, typical subtype-like protein n=1 Tax=Naegleria gruberi TaxID=5762 RepID=D2VE09_NAEGR|nr:leucine rich repeat, typical subtype-like protein [Naegleria gruberi]EFC45090.1 leucine rich repeat, typical subtype-like protein [Naegleria gruberi]|eukprot:XP_002677834.1 leucine rich repeat, typical subtype-like protein [Naegleria gruberi strain NEG-M]